MTLLDTLRTRIGYSLQLANQSTDAEDFQERLEKEYESGRLDQFYIEKAKQHTPESRIKAYQTTDTLYAYYNYLYGAMQKTGEMPEHGKGDRDHKLACFWKEEPILSGAVYSMSAKMTSLRWTVSGRKNLASYFAQLLSRAVSMGPKYDWGDFISATAQDFYVTDRGSFWETARKGNSQFGRLADIAHIDALNCTLTGSAKYPMIYVSSLTGQEIKFKDGEFIHFSSLKSPREDHLGIGFCAVSRAYRAAKLLLGLHNYDEEKLANLPPEGVAAVTGLTKDEFEDALALWQAARKKNDSLTFPQVLWLIGSMPNAKVALDFVGFSQMPESFDRRTVIEQYVNVLALDFGVDAREFWPISTSSMGTAAESEIQHMKAKGKGPGEFISIVERQINGEMPEGVMFEFDTQDIEEDMRSAEIAKAWVEALLPLTQAGGGTGPALMGGNFQNGNPAGQPIPPQNAMVAAQSAPPSGQMGPEQKPFLKREYFMRLLADKGIIPNWMVGDERSVVFDSSVQEKAMSEDDVPCIYKWDKGVLSVQRLPAYTVIGDQTRKFTPVDVATPETGRNGSLPLAELLQEISKEVLEEHRGIRGKPIPAGEALRGDSATVTAVRAEIDRWRKHPILSQYVPDDAEEDEVEKILNNVKNQIAA